MTADWDTAERRRCSLTARHIGVAKGRKVKPGVQPGAEPAQAAMAGSEGMRDR
jgi:hypothetical protein